MWRLVVLTAILQTMSASSRTIVSSDVPFLSPQDILIQELVGQFGDANQLIQQRYSPYRSTYTANGPDDEEGGPQQEKRSFAMLAHWGALSNMGKQRSPIREVARWRSSSSAAAPDAPNAISAETRARAGGQPLRWG